MASPTFNHHYFLNRLYLIFFPQKVQVGTLKSKHTTVPLLYNLDTDGLDVIDFPGLDDNDDSVPELAQLMLTLSQIIIFVVDYK